jgi:hypothetical protein
MSTSEVDTWRTVSFWTEKLTKVLIWSFPKIDVSSVMRIETQGLKNKIVKTQGLKMYLTLNFLLTFLTLLNIIKFVIDMINPAPSCSVFQSIIAI